MDILRRHLPPPGAVIADVGGGPGVYASQLAADGYRVHLLDLIPLHIEQARAASSASKDASLASAEVGDACNLPWPDGSLDVVLLLGPLYHLTTTDARLAALKEALRVLRPGGLLAAAAISHFASTYDGLAKQFITNSEFRSIVERDIHDGQHRNPARHPDWFTTAYFHHPRELGNEIRDGGFDLSAVLAVEGPAGWLSDLDWWLGDDGRRDILLSTIRSVEDEPSLLGASPHLLAVARKG